MVEFIYQGLRHYRPWLERTVRTAAKAAFGFAGYQNFEVAVLFTTKSQIKRLNGEYRNVEKATDVISFPATDDFSGDNGFFGDLAISIAVARKQARDYGQRLPREITFLTIHGCLHLLGYDHKTEKDERRMRDAQREILESIKEKTD